MMPLVAGLRGNSPFPHWGARPLSLTELFTNFGNCGMQGLGASSGLLHDQAQAQSLKGLQKPTWGALQLKKYIWALCFSKKILSMT